MIGFFSNQIQKHFLVFCWFSFKRLPTIAAMFSLRVSVWVASAFIAAPFYSQAHAFCFDEAGALYGVPPNLLRGIAQVESSMNPHALNEGHVKRTRSVDIGLMQINSRWLTSEPLKSLGYTQAHLLNPCANVKIGAWILAQEFRQLGTNWDAVGAYNASCRTLKGDDCSRARLTYAWKVFRAMERHQ